MTLHVLTLFTHPNRAWEGIRQSEQTNDRHYLKHLLVLALIPCVSLFIGTTYIGWSLGSTEPVRLTPMSAVQLALLLYICILVGAIVMGAFVKWMARAFETTPTLNQCIGFIAYAMTPFLLAGIVGIYPDRWLTAAALLVAGAYSSYLLYIGMPTFMHERSDQSMLYFLSTWGLGLLTLVTILVFMLLFWRFMLAPSYTREFAALAAPASQLALLR